MKDNNFSDLDIRIIEAFVKLDEEAKQTVIERIKNMLAGTAASQNANDC